MKTFIIENLINKDNKLITARIKKDGSWINKFFPHKLIEINQLQPFSISLSQKIYNILNDIFESNIRCPLCNNYCRYITFSLGYSQYCGATCGAKSKILKEGHNEDITKKRNKKWANRISLFYNQDANIDISYFIKTIKSSSLNAKTFTDYSEEISTIINLTKHIIPKPDSNLQRDYKLTERIYLLEQNISEYPVCNICNKNKKFINRNKGYSCSVQCGIIATCNKREIDFGVRHQSQMLSVHEKQHRHRYKKYSLPSGKIINVQGYENLALDELINIYSEDEIITSRKYMPTIWYIGEEGKNHRYYPDIYIPKDNLIIEVKSDYTLKRELQRNLLKAQATKQLGFNFKYMIFSGKGSNITSEVLKILKISE